MRLADLTEQKGEKGLPPGDRKRGWYVSDLLAWGEMIGAELSVNAGGRRPDTRLLLQAGLVAQSRGAFRDFHYPAYRARWAEAQPVDEPEVVRGLLRGAGLDDAAFEEAQSDALAQRLDADTRAAIEKGVFGVPTLFVGERMFFGNDRFELVRHFIEKQGT